MRGSLPGYGYFPDTIRRFFAGNVIKLIVYRIPDVLQRATVISNYFDSLPGGNAIQSGFEFENGNGA